MDQEQTFATDIGTLTIAVGCPCMACSDNGKMSQALSLCRLYGSAFLRCLPFAVLSGAETALLYVFWDGEDKAAWRHPYPYALSAFIVGFVIVYRLSFLLALT